MILSFLFYAFLFYVLFKLVFDFIIPLYRTTKKVKEGFREMHRRAQEQQNGAGAPGASRQPDGTGKQEPLGEYIDFEEVKD